MVARSLKTLIIRDRADNKTLVIKDTKKQTTNPTFSHLLKRTKILLESFLKKYLQ